MTDANEALRALDNALDLASQVDGWESFPLEPLEKALDAMEVIRAHLSDPGYVRVPVDELRKLEESRASLWGFLDGRLGDMEKAVLQGITGQIWRVANTKRWGNTKLAAAQETGRG